MWTKDKTQKHKDARRLKVKGGIYIQPKVQHEIIFKANCCHCIKSRWNTCLGEQRYNFEFIIKVMIVNSNSNAIKLFRGYSFSICVYKENR